MNGICRFQGNTVHLLRASDDSEWLLANFLTRQLDGEDRHKLLLIRSLRVLADEEKRISELSNEQVTEELRLYGADQERPC